MTTDKHNNPIFIVGTPRSGTTLTAKILGRHSRLFMPGETHFFGDIYSKNKSDPTTCSGTTPSETVDRLLTLYGRYNEPPDQVRVDKLCDQQQFKQKLQGASEDYKRTFNIFMETQMQYEGKKRWGNNVPRDIFHIPEILSFYPDAKIIICVRDIRDFLLSYSGKWQVTSTEHVERLKKLYHPVVTSYLWKSSVKLIPKITKLVRAQNLHIVKYENLVTNPEKEVQALCSAIEEDYEEQMLQVTSANSSAGTQGNGIFSSSVGRWERDLSPEDASIAQCIGKKEMLELGYLQENFIFSRFNVWAKWLCCPIALLKALDANKDSRGPLLPYLFTRIKSIIS